MVYFVQMDIPDGEGPIKIGHTGGSVAYRVSNLLTGSPYPLTIRAEVPGSETLEREYHDRFAEARMRGEWFAPVPELLAFIEQIGGASRGDLERVAAQRAAEAEMEARRQLCDEYLEIQSSVAHFELNASHNRDRLDEQRAELGRRGIRSDRLNDSELPPRYRPEYEDARARMIISAAEVS